MSSIRCIQPFGYSHARIKTIPAGRVMTVPAEIAATISDFGDLQEDIPFFQLVSPNFVLQCNQLPRPGELPLRARHASFPARKGRPRSPSASGPGAGAADGVATRGPDISGEHHGSSSITEMAVWLIRTTNDQRRHCMGKGRSCPGVA